MSTDVIGSRYRLGSVVTCTPEATTWNARDTWLDRGVLVVTPEREFNARFTRLADALLDRSSAHLVGLYDFGTLPHDFVVFGVPSATLSDEQTPREEEDVLIAGRALGDALDALHERGIVHGDLHPGSVAVAESGDTALSPWPLSPRPANWCGPGGFGSDPDERRHLSAHDDLRALGAVLLGSLAGPPVLSSEQVANLERELSGRAPNAVAIADRALTPPTRGGYDDAAQLRDDCATALIGKPVDLGDARPDLTTETPVARVSVSAGPKRGAAGRPEGHRAAVVVAATGAAVLAGLWASGAVGAGPHAAVHPVAIHASACNPRPTPQRCADAGLPVAAAPSEGGGAHNTPPQQAASTHQAERRVSGGSSVGHGTQGSTTLTPGPSSNAARSTSTSTTPSPTVPSTTTTSGLQATSSTTSTSTTSSSTTSTTSTTSPTGTSVPSSSTGPLGSGYSQAAPNGGGGTPTGWSGSGGSGGRGAGG